MTDATRSHHIVRTYMDEGGCVQQGQHMPRADTLLQELFTDTECCLGSAVIMHTRLTLPKA